jgi:hypothetical protein
MAASVSIGHLQPFELASMLMAFGLLNVRQETFLYKAAEAAAAKANGNDVINWYFFPSHLLLLSVSFSRLRCLCCWANN